MGHLNYNHSDQRIMDGVDDAIAANPDTAGMVASQLFAPFGSRLLSESTDTRHYSSLEGLIANSSNLFFCVLNGARQVGKSTLAKFLGREGFGGANEVPYVTFDNATVQSAAQSDPDAYIRSFGGPVVVDEAQRVPDLFRAIKLLVDEDRHPGQSLLTGSADVMTLPAVSESLAGRVEVMPLQPYSQGELNGCKEEFLDRCFDDTNRPAEWSLSRGPVNLWD